MGQHQDAPGVFFGGVILTGCTRPTGKSLDFQKGFIHGVSVLPLRGKRTGVLFVGRFCSPITQGGATSWSNDVNLTREFGRVRNGRG